MTPMPNPKLETVDFDAYADMARGMCFRKRAYPTLRKASAVASERSRAEGVPIYPYGCPLCGQWHLTRREQR